MQVKLFKKTSSYIDRNTKEEKQATNLYVDCNGKLIPIAVKYFENSDGNDPAYSGRKAILTTFADELPAQPVSTENDSQNKK